MPGEFTSGQVVGLEDLGNRLQVKRGGQVVDGQVFVIKRADDLGFVKLAVPDMPVQVFK